VANGKVEMVKTPFGKKGRGKCEGSNRANASFPGNGPDTNDGLAITQLLLAASADPNIADAEGNTPLHQITDLAIAEIVLAKGAGINTPNNEGRTLCTRRLTQSQKLWSKCY